MQDEPLSETLATVADPARVRRYLFVGLWNTIVGYALYVGLMALAEALGFAYWTAIVPAHVLGTLQSWYTQRRWVFADGTTSAWASLGRFFTVYLGVLAVQLTLLPLGVEVFGVPPWISELGVIVVITVLNYFLGYFFTFKVQPR